MSAYSDSMDKWKSESAFSSPTNGLTQVASPGSAALSTAQRNQGISEGLLRQTQGAYGQLGAASQGLLSTGQNMFNQWGTQFHPVLQNILSQANKSPEWMVDRAATDANMSWDTARREADRNLSDLGVNPNSGRFAGQQNRWAMARAAAVAGAKTRAHESADATLFNRLMSAYGLGENLRSSATGLMGAGIGGLGQMAGGYAGLAGQWDRLAGEAGRYGNNMNNRGQGTGNTYISNYGQPAAQNLSGDLVSNQGRDLPFNSGLSSYNSYFLSPAEKNPTVNGYDSYESSPSGGFLTDVTLPQNPAPYYSGY